MKSKTKRFSMENNFRSKNGALNKGIKAGFH